MGNWKAVLRLPFDKLRANGGLIQNPHPFVLSLSKHGQRKASQGLLDHLGHAEEAMLGHRGISQHGIADVAAGQRIGVDHVIA